MSRFVFDHLQLRSRNPEAAAEWFRSCLDAEVFVRPNGIGMRVAGVNVFVSPVVDGDGVAPAPLPPYEGLDHFGLVVQDLDAVARELKARNVLFYAEPHIIRPGVKGCFIKGPDQIAIEILERKPVDPA
ncbi:VOC family protein [Comamonadaceae bacterium PP-2]